jgi:DNA repair protein RadC
MQTSLKLPGQLAYRPKEFKLITLRELPERFELGDTPERIVDFWRESVASDPRFNPEAECLVAVLLNTRRKITGYVLLSIGTKDTLLAHPAEFWRPAVVANAAAAVMVHSHPSGDPAASEADIKVTRDLIRAGQLLKIDLLDSIVVGRSDSAENAKGWVSLRELGFFYS